VPKCRRFNDVDQRQRNSTEKSCTIIHADYVGNVFVKLFHAKPEDTLSIVISESNPNPTSMLQAFEDYYDSLVIKVHPPLINPSSPAGRPAGSRFDQLHFAGRPISSFKRERKRTSYITKVLERKKVALLFEGIIIESDRGSLDGSPQFMPLIRDLVLKDRSLSSFTVSRHHFSVNGTIALGEIIRANQLRCLVVDPWAIEGIFDFAGHLTRCLQAHIETFANGSVLRELRLGRLPSFFDSHEERRQIFDVIGTIPRLQSFSVRIQDPVTLELLTEFIKVWKIPSVAFNCDFSCGDANLRPVFDATVASRYLKHFYFSWGLPGDSSREEDAVAPILQSIQSPTRSLQTIDIRNPMDFPSNVLSLASLGKARTERGAANSQLRQVVFPVSLEPECSKTMKELYRVLLGNHPFFY